MKDTVFRIVSEVMGVDITKINEESSPDSIEEWDSLMHMNLVLALEEEFGVEFSEEQIVEMMNVELIITTLMEAVAK